MKSNDNFVKVTIYGQEYTIKAPADATYIKNIAEYVDQKMREIQEELNTPQVILYFLFQFHLANLK